MIKNNFSKGSSILELIVYILLTSTIMAETAKNLQSSYKIYKNTKIETKIDLKIKRVEAFLYKESLRDEMYFGVKKYIFHKNLNSFSSKYSGPIIGTLQIHPESAVLESLNLIPSLFYKNDKNSNYSGILNIKDLSNRQSLKFAGVYISKLILFDQNYNLNFIGKNSWSLDIKNSFKNRFEILSYLSIGQQKIELNNINYFPELVLPVQDHFIIYTDLNNSLRRHSLFTKSNQPIEEGISFKKLDLENCEIKLIDSTNKSKIFKCSDSHVELLDTANLLDG